MTCRLISCYALNFDLRCRVPGVFRAWRGTQLSAKALLAVGRPLGHWPSTPLWESAVALRHALRFQARSVFGDSCLDAYALSHCVPRFDLLNWQRHFVTCIQFPALATLNPSTVIRGLSPRVSASRNSVVITR